MTEERADAAWRKKDAGGLGQDQRGLNFLKNSGLGTTTTKKEEEKEKEKQRQF